VYDKRATMPGFRPKHSKKVAAAGTAATIDSKHREHVEKFEDYEQKVIPALEERIACLRARRKSTEALEEALDLKDEITALVRQIRRLRKEKSDYYLQNSKLIFDYFEDKKNISEGRCGDNVKRLDEFFRVGATDRAAEQPTVDRTREYLTNVDVRFLDVSKFAVQTFVCKLCRKGELVPVEHEGVVVCNNLVCGKQFQFLTENEKPSYREPPQEVCFYAYKRINHFREILAQFQAKESTQIPPEVLNDLRSQIRKERRQLATIDNKKAKEMLKKLGYNKYYEHIPFIKDKLGIKPPVMTPDLEDRLCNLFIEIQRPYAKYCPDDRVNFLNYYYTVYKLCELLGQTQFLDYFPMLKDRDKRIEQDEIWRKICQELGWEFIATT
jgi:hypothetical protein